VLMDSPNQHQEQLKESLQRAFEKQEATDSAALAHWMQILLTPYNPTLPTTHLLHALTAKHHILNAKSIEWLTQRFEAIYRAKPLIKNRVLTIIGTIHSNKNDLKKSLKSAEISYTTTIDETLTHVLVGHRLKMEEFEQLSTVAEDIVRLTEPMFIQFQSGLSETFLTGDAVEAAQIQQVAELLLHEDEANIEIGLNLLKSGGVPPELISELFIIYRFSSNTKHSKFAQKLLKIHGSVALQELMPKLKKNWWSLQYEDWLKQTELVPCKIYQYAYLQEPGNHNLLQKAIDSTPATAMTAFLYQAMAKWTLYGEPESISIPAELDFETHKDLIYRQQSLKSIYVDVRAHHRIKTLPKGISQLVNLEKLTIKTALHEFPKEVQQLPALKYLDLNMLSIRELKDIFDSGFQNLQTLFMRQMRIHELPFGIGNLAQLKYLDLQGGDIKALPPDFRQLKNLEELNLNMNRFQTVPDVLFLMPQLKKLHISAYWPEKEIRNLELLREALPDTKVIF
jgi:Leucine-rich repeat (LRR) protein